MKFDSFSRFLKSDLYKDSLVAEMSGKLLPFDAYEPDPMLDIGIKVKTGSASTLDRKKQQEDEPVSRRRSILPWNNLRKDRSKSKDRGERDSSTDNNSKKVKKTKSNNVDNQPPYHSMTSLASSSHAEVGNPVGRVFDYILSTWFCLHFLPC